MYVYCVAFTRICRTLFKHAEGKFIEVLSKNSTLLLIALPSKSHRYFWKTSSHYVKHRITVCVCICVLILIHLNVVAKSDETLILSSSLHLQDLIQSQISRHTFLKPTSFPKMTVDLIIYFTCKNSFLLHYAKLPGKIYIFSRI